MPNPLTSIRKAYAWWVHSLLSCLPEKWAAYFSGEKSRIDLIIAHRDGTLVVTDSRGKVIDSVALEAKIDIDLDRLPQEESQIRGLSTTQVNEAGKLISRQDPPLSTVADSLDLDLTDSQLEPEAESLDLLLERRSADGGDRPATAGHSRRTDANNVIALNSKRDEDSTVVLDDGDETVRFLESDSEEDTVIIKGDQGNLLQFETQNQEGKESTILFRSDGGKIRPVSAEDLSAPDDPDRDPNSATQLGNLLPDHDPTDYAAVARLLENHLRRKKGLYLLPDSKVLDLNLTYPIEAIQNIENVLKYDLEKHIPLSNQEVRYFYALNVDPVREKVKADVAVIKAEEYNLLNLTLEPFQKAGLLCTSESFYRKYGGKINFLEAKAQRSWQAFAKIPALHLALNWLLFWVLLGTPLWTLHQGIAAIGEKTSAEINRVEALVSEFNSINVESDFGLLLKEQVNTVPRSIELLSVLSSNINKQAWLHQFSFKNNEIRIKGEAESATRVSDDLNATGLFQSIKFISSIVKNARSGKESFELLLTLKSDAKNSVQ